MHAIVSKISYPQYDLLSPILKPFQSLIEIHPNLYDLIEIQLQMTFQEKVIMNKLLTIYIHASFTFSFLSLIIFVLLLLMIDLYIHA